MLGGRVQIQVLRKLMSEVMMLQPRYLILMYECVYVGVMGGGGWNCQLDFY